MGNGTVTVGISDGAAVPITAQSDLQFKIVVVDGTARKANPGLNWNNYDAVKSALDLKE
ncbi:MAG: hypothetical protein IPP56_00635 [Bacteroidetes bacterium]|nr:hypothetical protein [Bacteroidota bacterium]MBK9798283.1 hypothetical protein [Bacteroidota bacterium]